MIDHGPFKDWESEELLRDMDALFAHFREEAEQRKDEVWLFVCINHDGFRKSFKGGFPVGAYIEMPRRIKAMGLALGPSEEPFTFEDYQQHLNDSRIRFRLKDVDEERHIAWYEED